MSDVTFSAEARADRREITRFTRDRFGVEQVRRLLAELRRITRTLVALPGAGRRIPELDPQGHRMRIYVMQGRFLIVYEETDGGIHVHRILHGARDIAAELGDES